ncbi:MAG: hypothetical protein RLZZ42_521, partial [Bacteroidota bacterium]
MARYVALVFLMLPAIVNAQNVTISG